MNIQPLTLQSRRGVIRSILAYFPNEECEIDFYERARQHGVLITNN